MSEDAESSANRPAWPLAVEQGDAPRQGSRAGHGANTIAARNCQYWSRQTMTPLSAPKIPGETGAGAEAVRKPERGVRTATTTVSYFPDLGRLF